MSSIRESEIQPEKQYNLITGLSIGAVILVFYYLFFK